MHSLIFTLINKTRLFLTPDCSHDAKFELILIDDGSKDSSPTILLYAEAA
ncbi:MAG: hypothetical protein IJ530_04910 [Treponema sp.]|nr:hypothetical protein [Treponema sp.]MBQ8679085.1 hypothetical protein [Treponema sp.]